MNWRRFCQVHIPARARSAHQWKQIGSTDPPPPVAKEEAPSFLPGAPELENFLSEANRTVHDWEARRAELLSPPRPGPRQARFWLAGAGQRWEMKQYRIKALKGRHKPCLTRSSKIIFTSFSAQKIVNPPYPKMSNLNSGRIWQASAATRKWLQFPSTACRTTRIFFSPAANDCAGEGRSASQSQLFQMDERTWTPLCLAGRIWRIQRERFEHCNRGEIYPRSGTASSQNDVRAGISGVAEETRDRSRCFVTAGNAAPLKRGLNFFAPYPPLTLPQQTKNGFARTGRGGLNNSALSGFARRILRVPGLYLTSLCHLEL